MHVIPPVCPFPPEPWRHQMKQQIIGFQRSKILYFPVKHRSKPAKLLTAGYCRCQKSKKKKTKTAEYMKKNGVSKVKVKCTGTRSGYIQTWIRVRYNTFWGSISVCSTTGSTMGCHQKQQTGLILSGHSHFLVQM